MPTVKITPNLLETLLAAPGDEGFSHLSVHDSITFAHTVDGLIFPPSPNFAHATSQLGDPSDEGEETDIAELPRRALIDPGGQFFDNADYRLIGSIGRGGTGIVYQAHQRAINREVAIKVLRGHLRKDLAARQRFLSEARTIGALDHPNVIALHELAADREGRLFYSMKRIDGTAWSAVLAEKSQEENLAILLGVADAIRYAHSRGIIHRDIKPANVMLGRYGEVLVADWGLALPHPVPIDDSNTSSIGGTPAYMAPELAAGALDEVGPKTDVYLLGATLFEVLTGYPPHEGRTLIECVQNAADNRLRPTTVQSDLMDVAVKAMATDLEERFRSVESFQGALREYQQHQESIALVRRASKHADEASGGQNYERFGLAISLTREALDLWPDNRRAKSTLKRLRIEFAKVAAGQDDLDFALSLLEAAEEQDSELAAGIRFRREQRAVSAKREARYSTLFAHSPDSVLVTRMLDGTVLDANETFLRLFEHERDDVVGARVAEFQLWVCPERREDFVRLLRETGRADNFETVLRSRTGRKIPVLISARRTELDGESLVVAHTRDITIRRVAEDELRRSRTRLREIQQLASLGTWEYNLETNQTTWSEETYKIAGISPNEVPPNLEEYLNSVHADDRERTRTAIRAAIEHGAAYQIQIRQRRSDGSYGTVIGRGQPIIDSDGRVVELFGTLLDISDRKRIEIALTTERNRLQSLLDFCDRSVFALDRDGILIAATSRVREVLKRENLCLNGGWRFEPSEPLNLRELTTTRELTGQFAQDCSPTGPTLHIRVVPTADMLRCEVLD